MLTWIRAHTAVLWWAAAASVVVLAAMVVVVPWIIVRIPADYFDHRRRHRPLWADRHPALRGLLLVAKNLLGFICLLAGLAMLVTPGQGLLTLLVGIMLMDFPGKFRLLRAVVRRPAVLGAINWLRRRGGQGPLVIGEEGADGDGG